MSRHPYTNAADFVRLLVGHDENGSKLSRSDASLIRQAFAEVTGIDDHDLACRLSRRFEATEGLSNDHLRTLQLQGDTVPCPRHGDFYHV